MIVSKRKPYRQPMPSNWWRQLGFYRFYMLREGTALPAVWFSLVLLYGLYALKNGEGAWLGFVHFLQNPLVLIINVVALLAALLHTATWFVLAPKATIVIARGEKVGPRPFIIALWVAMVIITLAVLALICI